MRPRCDLRDDPTVGTVLRELRQNNLAEDRPVVADHGGGSFIAASLDTEDDHQTPWLRNRIAKTTLRKAARASTQGYMPFPTPIRIGTRGSPLALAQAEEARTRLIAAEPRLGAPGALVIVPISTTGDRVQDRPLSDIGNKGLFVKEIEQALADGRIDIAVHSMKDVETWIDERFLIGAILPREDPRDAFICRSARSIVDLPVGARLGTTSVRRQAFAMALHPGLRLVTFRGNVETRLRKLQDGLADATLLAVAGLKRAGTDRRRHCRARLRDDDARSVARSDRSGVQSRRRCDAGTARTDRRCGERREHRGRTLAACRTGRLLPDARRGLGSPERGRPAPAGRPGASRRQPYLAHRTAGAVAATASPWAPMRAENCVR